MMVPPQPQPFVLKPLDWDTAFFGARMGSIVATSPISPVTPATLRGDLLRILTRARADGYAHLIFRAGADDTAAIQAAEDAGCASSTWASTRPSTFAGAHPGCAGGHQLPAMRAKRTCLP